jgi:cytochrome c
MLKIFPKAIPGLSSYCLVLAAVLWSHQTVAAPGLGQEISQADLAAWDISIDPSGAGLPEGGGSAKEGEAVYNAKCASCHGAEGAGKPADPLVGGIGSLAGEAPARTVGSYWPYATTLFDYTRRAMPYDNPQSLSNDELYAVSAYILFLNGIIDAEQRLDAASLAQVEMPNRNGFNSAWPR